jgi:hypothetical protein
MFFPPGHKDGSRHRLRRLTLALATLCRRGLEDSRAEDFALFSKNTAAAKPLMGRGSGPLARLETAGACLEKTALDVKLLELKPDGSATEALLFLARALELHADFLAGPGRAPALSVAAANISAALKTLARAKLGAQADTGNFIPNLKFCTIYSGLEKTAYAVGDYAELLARAL